MNSSQRIALNTVATYIRSILAAGLALFSARWVLNALGQTDFGLFIVVGSLIVFITVINTVMATSSSRHYAFAIGQGVPGEVNHWFNAALSIHVCLAIGLSIVGWPAGEYFIVHFLNIPADRLSACLWVFRISLGSAFIGMISVPFIAMFTAKQRIAEVSVWGLIQSVMTFTLAWLLTSASGDRLMFYALGMAVIYVFVQSAQMLRAFFVFRECAFELRQWFEINRLKELISFAGWNLFGGLGATLREHGSAILLNLFFGPTANAAYGIAKQVSTQTNQLSGAMMVAFSPEIITREGSGDRDRMLALSLQACKFGTILSLLFAVPLIVEMDYVLELWLLKPPLYAALFCGLILTTHLIDRLSAGYIMAVNAHGRIAAYQVTLGTTLVLTLPLAWLFLKLGFAPTSIGVAFIITMTGCSVGRVLWARRLFGMPVNRWVVSVIIPCTIVCSAATLGALAPRLLLPASFFRLILVVFTSMTATLLTGWFLALDGRERDFAGKNFRRLLDKTVAACRWIL